MVFFVYVSACLLPLFGLLTAVVAVLFPSGVRIDVDSDDDQTTETHGDCCSSPVCPAAFLRSIPVAGDLAVCSTGSG